MRSTSDGGSHLGALGPLPDAERRRGDDDADDHEHRDADRQQHAEVADHRDLRDAQCEEGDDAGERGGEQRGREVGERFGDRVGLLVEHHLFLDTVVHLDREVDADTDQDRQTRDGDERQVDPDDAQDRERPQHADEHRQQRQQSPANPEHDGEDHGHQSERSGAEGEHAALEIVVDLGEVHRRAGDGELEAVEGCSVEHLEHVLGGRGLLVECGIAVEHDAADRRAVDGAAVDVRERPLQRLADPELLDRRQRRPWCRRRLKPVLSKIRSWL